MSMYDRFEDFRTIRSEEKERLRTRADRDGASRREYVEYHKREMPEYHAVGLRMISEVLEKYDEPQRCPLGEWSADNEELVDDMLYSLHRFGATYVEYLQFDFAHRTPASRDSFATFYRNINAYKVLNSPEGTAICEDKIGRTRGSGSTTEEMSAFFLSGMTVPRRRCARWFGNTAA